MKKGYTISDLAYIVLSIVDFNLLFLNISGNKFVNYVNLLGVGVGVVISFTLVNVFLESRYKKDTLLLILFMISILISSVINKDNHQIYDWKIVTILFLLKIYSFIAIGSYLLKKIGFSNFLKYLFYISLIYCVTNDVLTLLKFSSYVSSRMFFLGNKYDIAYLHLNMVTFYLSWKASLNIRDKKVERILYLYTTMVCILIDCITGLVGIVLLYIFSNSYTIKKINKSVLWSIAALISFSVIYIYPLIVNSNLYQRIVIGYLNRSITMTGRMNIYNEYPAIMQNHWLWGYGYGSSYETIFSHMFMPNAQNGFGDFILQNGVVAAIIFVLIVLYCIQRVHNICRAEPLYVSILVYTILGSVEITLSPIFLGVLILMYFAVNYKNEIESSYNEKAN